MTTNHSDMLSNLFSVCFGLMDLCIFPLVHGHGAKAVQKVKRSKHLKTSRLLIRVRVLLDLEGSLNKMHQFHSKAMKLLFYANVMLNCLINLVECELQNMHLS